jgi:uncharacterized protein DUF1559
MKTSISKYLLVIIVILFPAFSFSQNIPDFFGAKTKGKKAQCINNLRQLGLSLNMYAMDHDGKFPRNKGNTTGKKSLGLLKEYGYLTNKSLFICPAGNGTSATDGDYFYAYLLTDAAPSNQPLAIDDDAHHGSPKPYNILYVGGQVIAKSRPPQGPPGKNPTN